MAKQRQDIVLTAVAEVQEAIRRLEKLDKKVDDLGNSGKAAESIFSKAKFAVGGFASAFALTEAASIATDLAKVGAEANDVTSAFNNLPQSTALLNDLRTGVRGTVPDVELMRASLQGIDLGGTNDQLKTFSEFARLESVRKGSDTLTVFRDILGGVFRGSTELLDNFGLSLAQVNGKIEEMAVASGKNANALSAVERRALLADAVMALMNQRLKENGEIATTAAEKMRQNAAAVENFKVRIGQFLTDAGDGLVSFFNEALLGANKFFDAIGVGGAGRLKQLAVEFSASKKNTEEQAKAIARLTEKYKALKDSGLKTTEQQKAFKDTIQKLATLVPGAVTGVDKYAKALDVNLDSVNLFVKAQQRLIETNERLNKQRILEGLSDNQKTFTDANAQIDELSKKLSELADIDPNKAVKFGFTISKGGNIQDDFEKASVVTENYQKKIDTLTLSAGESTKEFDNLVLALSHYVDLQSTTPGQLSAELGKSVEFSTELILRFKQLDEAQKASAEKAKKAAAEKAKAEKVKQSKTDIKKKIKTAEIKKKLDEIELNDELSKTEKVKEAITVRYESEIAEAQKKSAKLADILTEERDRQLAILEQQQQITIDSEIKTLQEKLALDGIELDSSLDKYDKIRASAKLRYASEIAEARKKSTVLAELKEAELQTELKKVDLQEIRETDLKIVFEVEADANEEQIASEYGRVLDGINEFYNAQIELAAGNKDLLLEIEAEKTDAIKALNTDLTDEIQANVTRRVEYENEALAGLEAGYHTFFSNILDTEKTGAEKREEIIKSVTDTTVKSLSKMLLNFILNKQKEVIVETTTTNTKLAVQQTAFATTSALNAKEMVQSTALTGQKTAEAGAGIFKAHANIPFVGIAIAAGFIAAMLATMSSLKGKAGGGRVKPSDVTESPFTPAGDDGIAGIKIGEYVLTEDETKQLAPILNALENNQPLPLVGAGGIGAPSFTAPLSAGIAPAVANNGIIERSTTVQTVPTTEQVNVQIETIAPEASRVKNHYREVFDDIIEPHQNLKNRNRRTSESEDF